MIHIPVLRLGQNPTKSLEADKVVPLRHRRSAQPRSAAPNGGLIEREHAFHAKRARDVAAPKSRSPTFSK